MKDDKNITCEHGKNVAPGEQISPTGGGEDYVIPVDKMMEKVSILDPQFTHPIQDISADGNENLTESQDS
jgi:hypothetical protein